MVDDQGQQLPEQIGSYKPTEQLGEGGFGIVYAAEAPDGTLVAIKVLRPELSNNPEVRERLRREAAASQSITSDRVARVIDYDTEGDRPYLVMELVRGSTLTEQIAQNGPLGGAMLTSVAIAIAEALRDIHASGVLHRDLKPSNVMLGPDGIKILDFGIAAINEAADFTRTGAILGSASWMSPEQITGAPVEAASDIFAMGLVLAFAALGRHPFGEGRPEALMYRIVQEQPDLEGVSGPSRSLIEATLRQEPETRPSVASVIDALSGSSSNPDLSGPSPAAPSGEPPRDATRVISSPSDSPAPADGRPKRTKLLVGVIAALLVGAAAAAFIVTQSGSGSDVVAAPPPTTTEPATTTTEAVTTTTENKVEVAPTTTTTTTLPPVPVYRLHEWEGTTIRWNPCYNPISIYLNNSDGELRDTVIAATARFLTQQAAELSEITGHLVTYRGLTDETTRYAYESGEKILIQISDGGDGILEADSGYAGDSFRSVGRSAGSERESDSYQMHLSSTHFRAFSSSEELVGDSKRLLMHYLGRAFGLSLLEESDFVGFGVTDARAMKGELMYWPAVWDNNVDPEWGPGDRLGMAVAQAGGCF
jgi:serine/threonine protein kinase